MKRNRRQWMQEMAAIGAAGLSIITPRIAVGDEPSYFYHGRCKSYKLPSCFGIKTGLKIQSIETYHQNGTIAFTRVQMNDGSEGWGQISTYDADIAAQLVHRKIASHVLGKDPGDWDMIVDSCIESNYKWPWSYVCRALSGVDTAIWDWFGKKEQKSVCALLGGNPVPFPVYGSSMSRQIQPKDEAARLLRLRDEKGFNAFKVRVGSVAGHNKDQWEGRTEELIPLIRKSVGDGIDLMADGNSCYTPPVAVKVGKMMEDHGYYWFEEPCPYWEYEWTAEVAERLNIAVSGGEQDNDLASWRRMIGMDAVDIVQPDILYVGGITRTLRVAAMGAEAGKACVPHSANLGMVTLFTLHVMGAIPNAEKYVEYSIEKTPWAEGLYKPALEVKDGKVRIPEEPGWGVTINKEWLANAKRESNKL